VPLLPERITADKTEASRLRGLAAIDHGLPPTLSVTHFNVQVAFAMTDFKVQARSMTKFVINIASHKKRPY